MNLGLQEGGEGSRNLKKNALLEMASLPVPVLTQAWTMSKIISGQHL